MDTNSIPQPREEQYDEIDLLEIIRYLVNHIWYIIALTAIPVIAVFLLSTLKKQSFADSQVSVILRSYGNSELNYSSIINANIIKQALEKNGIADIDPARLIPLMDISTNVDVFEKQLSSAQAKLSGETQLDRTERADDIRKRYENLLATQNNYLTLSYDMDKSPIDYRMATLLLSDMVRIFNIIQKQKLDTKGELLSEVDMSSLGNLTVINTASLNKTLSLILALKAKINALLSEGFNKNGFNPAALLSQLNYLETEAANVIISAGYSPFFQKDIQRKILVNKDKIKALNNALQTISESVAGNGSNRGNFPGTQGTLSAEYNAELFDRFLNVGESLSLVSLQKKLLENKLNLEFEKAELEELVKSFALNKSNQEDMMNTHAQLVTELSALSAQINQYLADFNNYYKKETLQVISQKFIPAKGFLTMKILALITIASLGFSILVFLLKRGLENKYATT